jgi:cytochrome c oxidase subunit III
MKQDELTIQSTRSSSSDRSNSQAISIGLMAALSAITMLFAAFTSAYIVRRGLGDDWMPLSLPRMLVLTPILLIAGSIFLEIGWRRTKKNVFRNSICVALLGMLFLAAQIFVWVELSKGVQISAHPGASFFCIFSVSFCVFVFGGIVTVIWSGLRGARGILHSKNAIYYWHYLTVLWLYLLGMIYWGKS